MSYHSFMYTALDYKLEAKLKKIVDRIIFSAKMSPDDHKLLLSSLVQGRISEGERRQINRIFDYIQTGNIKLVGW